MPSKSMVMRWLRDHQEFRDQYVRAREESADVLAEEIIEIADRAVRGEIDPHAARIAVHAREWVAARLKPKSYGDRVQIGGTVEHKHEIVDHKPDWLRDRVAHVSVPLLEHEGDVDDDGTCDWF